MKNSVTAYCCLVAICDEGLDYLTEYQMEDPNSDPCYICDLCQSKMDMRQVIHHVVGIRHRHKYMVSFQTAALRHYVLQLCGTLCVACI